MADENRIYTRTGDRGDTALFGGGRVPKDNIRVAAYGDVDELNAFVGAAAAVCDDAWIAERLQVIQRDLFSLGASLATPPAREGRSAPEIPPIPVAHIDALEEWMDEASEQLEPLRSFILPGGSQSAAALHVARTVCRRAERQVITLASREPGVSADIIRYLNRLSDFLFIAARRANHVASLGDVPWTP